MEREFISKTRIFSLKTKLIKLIQVWAPVKLKDYSVIVLNKEFHVNVK